MNTEIFRNINTIIDHDSKSTTYKLALLRGVIDVIKDNSPYINVYGNRVTIPTCPFCDPDLHTRMITENQMAWPLQYTKNSL